MCTLNTTHLNVKDQSLILVLIAKLHNLLRVGFLRQKKKKEEEEEVV